MVPAGSTSPSTGAGTSGDLAAVERAIAALETQRPVLGDDVVETALAPLRERQQQLSSGQRGEQRKLVSVLFADLVDFTVLSRRLDPEDTRTVVEACFARWQSAIEAHGGVVEKFIGDAVMAVFGLQQSYEDDAERAVRAGMAMVAATAELSVEVEQRFGVVPRMRVGIDTGEVVVSTLGERAGHEFVAVGPTVNRAARLQGAAPEGRVLVSTETYRQVRRAFNVQPLGGLELKGLDAPVDAYLIVSPRPRGFTLDQLGVVEGIEASTVGRAGEIRFLQERFLDVVDEGRYLVVDVVGDAGIGKSRLLRDFDLWLAGQPQVVWWFRGRASHVEQNRANSLTRDVIATRMEIAESDAPDVVRKKLEAGFEMAFGVGDQAVRAAHVVGTWLDFDLGTDAAAQQGVPTDPQSVRDQATVALGQYFARLAESQPVVILLEDLHWADTTSMRLLDDAERMWRDAPIMVVATTRSTLFEERPRWGSGLEHHVRLNLGALSRRESRTLVLELLQRVDDPPVELVELVVDSAEGNPFYIEELVTWLIDSGVVVPDSPRWRVVDELVGRLVVPPSLKGLLQARLDALPSPERVVLQRASVVGRIFWDDAVTHLSPEQTNATDAGASFDHLLDRDLVFERELSAFESSREFLFKHALLRDVAYESVLRAHRREYHRRTARWLADVTARTGRVEEYAAIVAEHYDQAHDPAAAEWYLRAGRRARRMFALDEATHLLDRAQRLAPADAPALLFDVFAEQEQVLDRQGDRSAKPEILRRMDEVSSQLGDPDRTVTSLLGQSRHAFESSEYDRAVDLATRAADTARDAGLGARVAEGHLWSGKALTWQGDGAAAQTQLDTALVAARTAGQTALVAETLRYLAMLASNEGRFADALEFGVQAREEFAKDGDLEAESTAMAQHAVTLFNLGRVAESREIFEQVLPVFMASGHLYRQSVALGNLASSSLLLGDFAAAERWCEQAIERSNTLGDVEGTATNRTILGLTQLWTNRWAEARENFEYAWRTGQEVGASMVSLDASLWLGVGMLEYTEPPDVTLAHARSLAADATVEEAGPQTAAHALLVLAQALLSSGEDARLAEADDAAGRAAAVLRDSGVEASIPQCTALRIVIARAGGLDPHAAAAQAAALVAELDQPAIDVAMRSAHLLGQLWELLSGSPDHETARQQLRDTVRAYVDRRIAGAESPELQAGFLAVPSVARLVAFLDTH
ncbi:MAG TPA: adenylate/guanylate cyclase domain-containing protein [Lapillicoccus sp.]|nr:adenylate/guanylate cyclase domain-containing protein [Lapillicoccus sp.]